MRCSSAPRAPISDSPTGTPSSSATGRLICGAPASPAMQVSDRMFISTPRAAERG